MRLFYRKNTKSKLVRYAEAGYLSDTHKARSQSGYVFTYGGTVISWRSIKQTLIATLLNHAKLITLYDAGRECKIHDPTHSRGMRSRVSQRKPDGDIRR
jgi:hypothetical protein